MPARTPEEARGAWRDHFADVHCGTTSTTATILEESVVHAGAVERGSRHATFLPTLADVTGCFARVKKRKSPGIDNIPPDLLATFPAQLANVLHPLMLKAALQGDEPALWKGGILCVFPKPDAKLLKCSDYREIALGTAFGKCYHKMVRCKLTPYLEKTALDSQCGGINARSTDFATHYLRTYLRHATARHNAIAIIFIDVMYAFYSLVRESVLPLGRDLQKWTAYWAVP